MLNMKVPGTVELNIIAPSGGVVAGRPYLINRMVVVPKVDAVAGALVAVYKGGGSFALPKAAGALALGVAVDWNPTSNQIVADGTTTGNFNVGQVCEAAASGDAFVYVTLTFADITAS